MRKFLIRWWYTSDFERMNYERMIRAWNGDVATCLFLDETIYINKALRYEWLKGWPS